jgi:hypothetical protein
MKQLGLIAAGLALVFLGAATAEKETETTLPGFPTVKTDVRALEPLGPDNKPLLKIVRGEFDKKNATIVWLLELQTDIGLEEMVAIGHTWYAVGAEQGPIGYFFDKDKVALLFRPVKLSGKLLDGKKGDRVRMTLDISALPADTIWFVDIRK